MEKLKLELESCHGIRKLDATLSSKIGKRDGRRFAVAIYAPKRSHEDFICSNVSRLGAWSGQL